MSVRTDTEMGVRLGQEQASKTNGYERPTDLERVSDKTGTDCTMAVGSY